MTDLQDDFKNLAEDIALGSDADGIPKVEEFFKIFSQLAAENGDCPDLSYSPVLSGLGYRVDGYAFDIPEGAESSAGDLYLAICFYRQDDALPIINAVDIEKAVTEVEKFLKLALTNKALDDLEESSHDYRLAMLIRSYINQIARVRVLVFTNSYLKSRKKVFDTSQVDRFTIHTNVFDIERYSKISSTGADAVEIDLIEDFSGGIPTLQASSSGSGYKSYLFAIHGPMLADIFAAYGNRLMEQNVRTYLQAKTNVNKGILKTIADEPSMFFAYNNGLTATASSVRTAMQLDGTVLITYIKDFQIVNGGQTTASILYARDGLKHDLSQVFVQVKLSVVDENKLNQIVPKISEYANTQNKVSPSDLASNSPMQVKIERLSKEVAVPQKAGSLYATKWFYERARGQYKNLFSYKTPSQKNKLETEYPKSQLIEKTDIAKFELSFDGRPHHVSEGSQKCFYRYVTSHLKLLGDGSSIGEQWFKNMVAKGILFRKLDKEIAQSDWYKNNKGLKAQAVTYTIAACAQAFRELGYQIDLSRIWKEQDVPSVLMTWLMRQAKTVHKILNNPPGIVKNPSEFCKKEFCWTDYVKGSVESPAKDILDYGVLFSLLVDEKLAVGSNTKKEVDAEFESAMAKLVPKAGEIRKLAESKRLISTNNSKALDKLEIGKISFNKSEKNSLINLLDRLSIEY